ncbi:MAG: ATP-binding protein [Syntrophobacter sp.]
MKRGPRLRVTHCLVILVLAMVLPMLQLHPAHAGSSGRHEILVIYPFNRALPFSVRFSSGLTEALEPFDLNTFEISQENLDLDRIDSNEYLDSLAGSLATKYASTNFDAIVAVTDWSLEFLLRRCESLSPGAPVLATLSLKGKDTSWNSVRKVYPVFSSVDVRETIDLIVRLQPTLKRIHIVSGSHPYERSVWKIREVVSQYRDGPEFAFSVGSSYEELLSAAAKLDSHDAILFLSFMRDGSGRSYTSQSVAGRLSETAGCPVYGMTDQYMYTGIVGGSMSSVFEGGLAVGHLLAGVLGMDDGAAAIGETRLSTIRQVDERQMTRWGLSEKNLLAGFEVVNRAPSLWRDYRGHVGGALLFFFAQGTLIFWLFIQWRSRKAAEQELRGTCRELEEKQEELGHARDLQDRTLGSLRESEATLQALLSSIPIGVSLIDIKSGTIRQANRAAAELLGIPPENMTGSLCPDCFHGFLSETPEDVSANGTDSFEDRLVSGQGRDVFVLKTVDRVVLDGRAHLIGCLLDITQRKLAEREARERAEQLVHADKMISLGVMAAGVTHEINNPNNFIFLNAPMLKKAWESVVKILDKHALENGDFPVAKLPYSRARENIPILLNGIIEGSERIKNIVSDMKEFVSEKPSGMTEQVDINAVLQSSLNLLANKLKKSTDNLFVEYGGNLPAVEANGQRVGQVMINLILNGAEALTATEQCLSIRSYYDAERGKVFLEVRDSGQGIQPEHLNRIFDPFFTTKRETGGTGLGLAISKKIVEAYGGSILISSSAGEGTTAVLELPACSSDNRSNS